MAKLKMLKAPKKPARSASLSKKEKYIAKVNAIRKENAHRHSINKKSESLDKVIAGIGSVSVRPSGYKAISIRGKRKPGRKKTAVGSVGKRRKKSAAPAPKRRRR